MPPVDNNLTSSSLPPPPSNITSTYLSSPPPPPPSTNINTSTYAPHSTYYQDYYPPNYIPGSSNIKYIYPSDYIHLKPRTLFFRLAILSVFSSITMLVTICLHCSNNYVTEIALEQDALDEAYLENASLGKDRDKDLQATTLAYTTNPIKYGFCNSLPLYIAWNTILILTLLSYIVVCVGSYVRARDFVVANSRSFTMQNSMNSNAFNSDADTNINTGNTPSNSLITTHNVNNESVCSNATFSSVRRGHKNDISNDLLDVENPETGAFGGDIFTSSKFNQNRKQKRNSNGASKKIDGKSSDPLMDSLNPFSIRFGSGSSGGETFGSTYGRGRVNGRRQQTRFTREGRTRLLPTDNTAKVTKFDGSNMIV